MAGLWGHSYGALQSPSNSNPACQDRQQARAYGWQEDLRGIQPLCFRVHIDRELLYTVNHAQDYIKDGRVDLVMIKFGAKIGVHAEATPAGIVSVLEAAVAQGTPIPWYKSVNNGTALQKVKEVSPTTKTMFRIAHEHEGVPALDNVSPDDEQEIAVRAGQLTGPIIAWAESNPGWEAYVDCIEIANEPDPAPENQYGYLVLGKIMREAVRILNYRYPGKLCLTSRTSYFATTPEYLGKSQLTRGMGN